MTLVALGDLASGAASRHPQEPGSGVRSVWGQMLTLPRPCRVTLSNFPRLSELISSTVKRGSLVMVLTPMVALRVYIKLYGEQVARSACGMHGRWTKCSPSRGGPLGGTGRSALPGVMAGSAQSWLLQRGCAEDWSWCTPASAQLLTLLPGRVDGNGLPSLQAATDVFMGRSQVMSFPSSTWGHSRKWYLNWRVGAGRVGPGG